jgi:HSP20 family protein
MGILDKVTSLLPWRARHRGQPAASSDTAVLRDDLDRWLQRLFEEPLRLNAVDRLTWAPSPTVRETDDELIVSVEVPGFDRGDLDLTLTPEGLAIRGERQAEADDEYVYRNFVLTVPLPPGFDLDHAEARVKHGVLTVRFPKTAAATGTRRIPVRT